MKYLTTAAVGLLTLILSGCASDQGSVAQVAEGRWHFRVTGQLDALSVADLMAAVRAIPQHSIFVLRIVNHNRVEAEVLPYQGIPYQVVERVHGHWQATEYVLMTG